MFQTSDTQPFYILIYYRIKDMGAGVSLYNIQLINTKDLFIITIYGIGGKLEQKTWQWVMGYYKCKQNDLEKAGSHVKKKIKRIW